MDIEAILEMYEDDYNPSSKVPGPRNMADSMRPGFYRGESVVKSHGQKLIELTEAGESSVSIAKKLGLKQQTVSNALNAIDSGTAGDEYKLSKPLKDFFKPKNQFSGKELTKNTELIEAIKEDASTMSDKEIKAKYDIHKSTLTKIKNENDITTRSSYLPEGEQKKSIPYAERYTAEEKSAMYKKRKDTETEEDRIKAKERDKKYRDKKFKEYKMEPSSRTPYDDLWKDITRSSKEGDRIKLVEGPKYSSGASYDDFKTRIFLDTKTGQTFDYNNLKQYLDSGKLEGVSYNSVIEPYNIKNQIAKSGLKEDIQKAYFGDKYKPPKTFRAQNTFHVHHIGGVASDPFSVQLTFADENLGLVTNKKFNKEWSSLIEKNAPLSERKNYLKFVKSKIGDNIAQTLEFPEVGKVRTFGEIGTDMQKLLSNEKFEAIDTKQILSQLEKLGCGKSAGGRIMFGNGTSCAIKGREVLEKGLKNGFKKNDQVLANTILKSGKFLKDAVSLRGLFGPAALAFTVAAEAGIVGYDMLATGKSFKEAIGSSLFNYALGDKTKIDSDEEFIKRLKSTGNMNDQQIGKMLNFKSVIDDMNRGFNLNTKLQDLEGVQEIRDEEGNIIVKGKAGKILDNQTNQAIDSEFFPDNAFKLDAERDALRADIQDYNRTGTPRRVTDYLLSDKAKEGADASALANLYVKQDQLQNAGTAGILPLVDKGIEKDLIDTRFNLQQMNNPTEYNDFAKYFMSRPKQEQSMIMGLGYREGGIASLNVNKK